MVQSPWLKSDPQQNLHQIALNNMNNSLLQPNLLNGLPQRYVRGRNLIKSYLFIRKLSPLAPSSGGNMSQPLPSLQHLATKFGLNTTQPQPSSLPNPSLNSTLPNPIGGSSHLRSLKSNHFGPTHAFSHQINPILNSMPQPGQNDTELPKPFAHGPGTRPSPSGPGPRVPPVDGSHPNMPGPLDGPSGSIEMETDEKGECKLCNSHEKIRG